MSVSSTPNAHLGAAWKTYGWGGGRGGVGTPRKEGKHGTREPRGLEALISETATWFPASVRKTYGRPTEDLRPCLAAQGAFWPPVEDLRGRRGEGGFSYARLMLVPGGRNSEDLSLQFTAIE